MTPLPIPKATFAQIVKHPTVWLLTVAVFIASFLLNVIIRNGKDDKTSCEKEKLELRNLYQEERKKNSDLTNALLVKNGIISEVKKITDSAFNK